MGFYCVRHGEIASNVQRIYAGWSEESLTSRGRQQARDAADKLISIGIEGIYCSPLRRTMETAEIIGSLLGLKPQPEEGFKELKMGPWEGKSEDQISREFPHEWQIWNTRPAELAVPGRETLAELQERTLSGIEKLKAKRPWRNLLIVTHVAIIRVLLMHCQTMDLNLYRTISIPNGQIFHLGGI